MSDYGIDYIAPATKEDDRESELGVLERLKYSKVEAGIRRRSREGASQHIEFIRTKVRWYVNQTPRRKVWSREKKRHDIETRQVARAYILVNRAPTLIHRGKAAR